MSLKTLSTASTLIVASLVHSALRAQAVSEEIEASIRVERGVGAIYAMALKDRPKHIRFIEIYADENAYRLHRDTPHFKKYLAVAGPMITGRQLVGATPVVISESAPVVAPVAAAPAATRPPVGPIAGIHRRRLHAVVTLTDRTCADS